MYNNIAISFIIPCKNEEDYIKLCIDSIIREVQGKIYFEIIVIDNGSSDNSVKLVRSYGEKVFIEVLEDVSISELRNQGVKYAKYDWLAFIDADVELINGWLEGLCGVLSKVRYSDEKIHNIITGATYSIPDNPTWIERVWFQQLTARDVANDTYINSGNLIVNKDLFERVGGFDPSFKTGEDVQFCKKAIANEGFMVKNKSINAAHHGYPSTICSFFNRERWHGIGMAAFLKNPWRSRDIILAYYYLLFCSILTLFSFWFAGIVNSVPIIIIIYIFPIVPLAMKRSNGNFMTLLQLILLYVIYGFARSFALIDIFLAPLSVNKKQKS